MFFHFDSNNDSCYGVGFPNHFVFTQDEKVTLPYFKDYWMMDFYWGIYDYTGYEIYFDDGYQITFHSEYDMEIPIERKDNDNWIYIGRWKTSDDLT